MPRRGCHCRLPGKLDQLRDGKWDDSAGKYTSLHVTDGEIFIDLFSKAGLGRNRQGLG